MKTLFLKVLDPSGHERTLKIQQFPSVLGTRLADKNQLRDAKLGADAICIDCRNDSYVIKTLDDKVEIRIGDLKLNSLEIPMRVPLLIGETQLTFLDAESKTGPIDFPKGEQAWYTESPQGLALLNSIRKSSATKLSIYLSGETGTGKEVLAKLMHLWSDRSSGAFVPINCGALSMSLVESELFGHVKGAFTGAIRDRPGALLQAHGGTLFLDEVGDLPMELQMKLLRFLESGEIRPVGSDRVLHAEVRLICATHKPLIKLVKEGKFRQDLYFRLASIPIEIPTLRSRPEDIRALALKFAKDQSKTLTLEAVLRLQAHTWPGNVRELRHAVERASGLSGPFETVIHARDLEFLVTQNSFEDACELTPNSAEDSLPGISSLKEMEKILILRALRLSHGNRSDAAKVLGIARSTLFEMMKRHQIMGPKANDYWLLALNEASS